MALGIIHRPFVSFILPKTGELVTAQPWLQDDGSVVTWGDPGAGGVIPLEVPVETCESIGIAWQIYMIQGTTRGCVNLWKGFRVGVVGFWLQN